MKINPLTNLESVTKNVARSASVKDSKNSNDSIDFTQTKAFESALKAQPEIRTEKMIDTQSKTSSLNYPPEELIEGISRLIAERILPSQ